MFDSQRVRLVVIIAVAVVVTSAGLSYRWLGDTRADDEAAETAQALEDAFRGVDPRDVNIAMGDLSDLMAQVPGRLDLGTKPTPETIFVAVAVDALGAHRCVIGRVDPAGIEVEVVRERC